MGKQTLPRASLTRLPTLTQWSEPDVPAEAHAPADAHAAGEPTPAVTDGELPLPPSVLHEAWPGPGGDGAAARPGAADPRPDPRSAEVQAELQSSIDAAIEAMDALQPTDTEPLTGIVEPDYTIELPEGAGRGKPGQPVEPGPVSEVVLGPEELRNAFGMPEAHQEGLQKIIDEHDVDIWMRPTAPEAPARLEEGAIPKHEDVKGKTVNKYDLLIGAHKKDLATAAYFKPKAPERPPGLTDAQWAEVRPLAEARFLQREAEFWDQARMMTELQSRAADQVGTSNEIQVIIDADGIIQRLGVSGDTVTANPFTGDHDIYDIRYRDGRPLESEVYAAIVAEMKAADISVAHGAHMWWNPKTAAEWEIFRAIVAKHSSGQEVLIRLSPGQKPRTAGVPD